MQAVSSGWLSLSPSAALTFGQISARHGSIGPEFKLQTYGLNREYPCWMKKLILSLSVLLLWMGAHYTYARQLHNSVIVIIRHAEKPADGDGLAPAGEARAHAYVDYFKNFTLDSKPIHFDYLFAAKDSHESKRPKLTIKPLSKALGLGINTDFKEQDYASLAEELRSGPYSNKNILVCWHHGKIPELLASLGADPQKLLPPKGKWPEDVFGWFVRLEYDQNGNLNVKVQDEDLMPGDAANPPPQVKASPLSKP
jgi:hypothetical protein